MRSLIHGSWAAKHSSFGLFVLRVATGLVFVMHGWQKLSVMGIEGTAGFLSMLGFPIPMFFATVLIAVELLGGIALIPGLWTYLAAKLTAIVALVAFFAVHIGNGFFVSANGYEFILMLFAASVAIMLAGPGRWSLGAAMRS